MKEDQGFPDLAAPATKGDVIDALLRMQQIASELAEAILAGESDDRAGVVAAME
jgi:hypothetical protein